jgi:NhaP-type Na+/H+ or K+/H+ antiporter
VPLLAIGLFFSLAGLGWIAPGSLGNSLFGIVQFSIANILFEGGLNLQWALAKRVE